MTLIYVLFETETLESSAQKDFKYKMTVIVRSGGGGAPRGPHTGYCARQTRCAPMCTPAAH